MGLQKGPARPRLITAIGRGRKRSRTDITATPRNVPIYRKKATGLADGFFGVATSAASSFLTHGCGSQRGPGRVRSPRHSRSPRSSGFGGSKRCRQKPPISRENCAKGPLSAPFWAPLRRALPPALVAADRDRKGDVENVRGYVVSELAEAVLLFLLRRRGRELSPALLRVGRLVIGHGRSMTNQLIGRRRFAVSARAHSRSATAATLRQSKSVSPQDIETGTLGPVSRGCEIGFAHWRIRSPR